MNTGFPALDDYLDRIGDEDELFGWWIGEDGNIWVLWHSAGAGDPIRPYVLEVFPQRIGHKGHQINGALWTRDQLVRWSRQSSDEPRLTDAVARVRAHLDRTAGD